MALRLRLLYPAAPAPLAHQPPPLAHPRVIRPVGVDLVAAAAATPSATATRLTAVTAAVTAPRRLVVARATAPSAVGLLLPCPAARLPAALAAATHPPTTATAVAVASAVRVAAAAVAFGISAAHVVAVAVPVALVVVASCAAAVV